MTHVSDSLPSDIQGEQNITVRGKKFNKKKSKIVVPTGLSSEDSESDIEIQLTQNDPTAKDGRGVPSKKDPSTATSGDGEGEEKLSFPLTCPLAKCGGRRCPGKKTIRWNRPPPPKTEFKGKFWWKL